MAQTQTDEQSIFEAARKIDSCESRQAYVQQMCGDDSVLQQRVAALLRAYDLSESFLESPPPGLEIGASHLVECLTIERPITESTGTLIGPYKLLQQIGEGGMGVVFMAEQTEPIRRTVALKIIKPGMDTRQVIARFEAERQAVAMMDHPNIAKVLDAGTTQSGRPYFVMELVKGVPITKYCDEKHLPLRARLELFTQVCQSVQHAHQKGIIHRDIKPNNVLVAEYDNQAVPKVIDFGVAKATAHRLTERTMFTEFGQVLGTMEYMSPEQSKFNQLDIDTRSDIYSLGVLLYELLAGSTPFEGKRLHAAAFDEMLRIIREEDPPKPSTRLTTSDALPSIAANRHIEPARLSKDVRGELDWIVMKALEKDRNRRYETASGFAADIERHLHDEPVEAGPPSAAYRLRKFAKRNKGPFAAIVAVTLALLIGMSIATWQALRAEEARRRAETEANKSEQVARFLQDMLKGVGPSVALGRDTTMLREILNQTAERLNELKAQPAVEADLRATLGNIYADLGQFAVAESMLRHALALRKNLHGEPHADVASSLHDLAEVLRRQTRFPEAEAMHREALSMRQKLFDNEHPDVLASLDNLAETLSRQLQRDKAAEAEPMLFEVLAARRKRFGYESREVARSLFNLGLFRLRQNKPVESELLHREALAIRRKLFPNGHPEVADSLTYVGSSLNRQLKFADAEAFFREALAMRRKLFGEEHPDVGMSLEHLGIARFRQGDLAGAEVLYRQALTMQRKLLVESNPDLGGTIDALANCLVAQREYPEAESLRRELLAIYRKRMTATQWFGTGPLNRVADVLRAQGKIGEIEDLYREELALRSRLYGSEDPNVAALFDMLAGVLGEEEKFAEAETIGRESLRILRQALPQDDWRIASAMSLLGGTLSQQGKYQEAEPLLLAAYTDLSMQPRRAAQLVEALNRIVQLYQDWGMPKKAAEWRAKLPDPTSAARL